MMQGQNREFYDMCKKRISNVSDNESYNDT